MTYRNKTAAVFIILFSLIAINTCYATDTLKNSYPAAVLVQLRSEHNRIEALMKARMYKQLAEVQNDALYANAAMINDFQIHFNRCPVYYYIDTNIDLIREKKFNGVLLDDGGAPVKNAVINDNSTGYLVTYYGYPVSQSRLTDVVTDSNAYRTNSGEPVGRGLVILNDKFQQVNYFYKLEYDDLFAKRKLDKKFYYTSKHFDIEYYPFAGLFNEKLTDRSGNHRVPDKQTTK